MLLCVIFQSCSFLSWTKISFLTFVIDPTLKFLYEGSINCSWAFLLSICFLPIVTMNWFEFACERHAFSLCTSFSFLHDQSMAWLIQFWCVIMCVICEHTVNDLLSRTFLVFALTHSQISSPSLSLIDQPFWLNLSPRSLCDCSRFFFGLPLLFFLFLCRLLLLLLLLLFSSSASLPSLSSPISSFYPSTFVRFWQERWESDKRRREGGETENGKRRREKEDKETMVKEQKEEERRRGRKSGSGTRKQTRKMFTQNWEETRKMRWALSIRSFG